MNEPSGPEIAANTRLPSAPDGSPLAVLELIAHISDAPFDRLAARRALMDANRSVRPDETPDVWAAMVAAGSRVGLRMRLRAGSAEEVRKLVAGGGVLAIAEFGDGPTPRWGVLRELRRGQVLVARGPEDPGEWRPLGELVGSLASGASDGPVRWLEADAALPCDHAAAGHGHLKPFARLLRLARAEMADVWVLMVFASIVGVLALATPLAVEALVNTVAFGRLMQPIVVLAVMLLVFLGFAAVIRGLQTYVAEIIQRRVFVRLVADLAYRLPNTRGDAFDGRYGPEVVNRFFDVVTVQKVAATLLLDAIGIVLTTLIGMCVLAFYHPILLGFDAFLLAAVVLGVFVLGRGAVRTAIAESAAKYQVADWLEDIARNPVAFKYPGGSEHAAERCDRLAIEYLNRRRAHFSVLWRQILFALGLQAIAGTVLLGLGGWLVITDRLTLGQLVAAELIVAVITGSFAKLGKHLENFYDLLASVDKLGYLLDLPVERQDGERPRELPAGAFVRVHNVSYRFSNTDPHAHAGHDRAHEPHDVLGGVSLSLGPGERIALTGPPGSGRSTFLDMLFVLREPAHGFIELNGVDLRSLRPAAVREQVALVRTTELFHATLAENVHLDRPGVGSREVREALAAVGLLDEALHLPEGLNTELLPGGAPLSGSQVTRLMLARAIVGQPRLLLIDAELDVLPDECLREVMELLLDRQQPWTVVIATGRREIAEQCDRTIRLGGARHAAGAHASAPAPAHAAAEPRPQPHS